MKIEIEISEEGLARLMRVFPVPCSRDHVAAITWAINTICGPVWDRVTLNGRVLSEWVKTQDDEPCVDEFCDYVAALAFDACGEAEDEINDTWREFANGDCGACGGSGGGDDVARCPHCCGRGHS